MGRAANTGRNGAVVQIHPPGQHSPKKTVQDFVQAIHPDQSYRNALQGLRHVLPQTLGGPHQKAAKYHNGYRKQGIIVYRRLHIPVNAAPEFLP